jgi:hypothetical protein
MSAISAMSSVATQAALAKSPPGVPQAASAGGAAVARAIGSVGDGDGVAVASNTSLTGKQLNIST